MDCFCSEKTNVAFKILFAVSLKTSLAFNCEVTITTIVYLLVTLILWLFSLIMSSKVFPFDSLSFSLVFLTVEIVSLSNYLVLFSSSMVSSFFVIISRVCFKCVTSSVRVFTCFTRCCSFVIECLYEQ